MLATASLTLAAQDDPVREVMSVPAGIGPAMRGKDTSALEKIWSPQMKVNSPGNTIMDRSTVLKLLSQGSIKYSAFKDVVEDFAPGAVALWHSHPGEELVYVPQGELEFQFDGEKPVTLRTGDVLFVPFWKSAYGT